MNFLPTEDHVKVSGRTIIETTYVTWDILPLLYPFVLPAAKHRQ